MKLGSVDPDAGAKFKQAAGNGASEEFPDLLSPIRRGCGQLELPADISAAYAAVRTVAVATPRRSNRQRMRSAIKHWQSTIGTIGR